MITFNCIDVSFSRFVIIVVIIIIMFYIFDPFISITLTYKMHVHKNVDIYKPQISHPLVLNSANVFYFQMSCAIRMVQGT